MLYGKYQFLCRFKNAASLPSYKGSTFRGVFGRALKQVVCALKRQACAQCLLRQKCVYALVFETSEIVEVPEGSRIASPPHPFVIEPPLTTETEFPGGASFDFNLIHIPFVSVRDNLPGELLKEPKDPGTLMLSLIKEEKSRLTVNLVSGKMAYKKTEMDMMPAHLALYAFFAMQKKDCPKEVETCGNCTDCFLDIQSIYEKQGEINNLYKRVCGSRPLDEMSDSGIISLSSDNFNMYKGKIKRNLLGRFGPYALKELEIASMGRRPGKRYGLIMDKGKIEIVY